MKPSDPAPLITIATFEQLLAEQHPFSSVLGIKIKAIGYGTASLVLPAHASHQRLGNIVAGPMLMGLADLAMYAAILGATGQAHAVTSSLTINFLRKAPAGAVIAHAKLQKVGRLCIGEVTLHAIDATELIAHAVSTWSLPPRLTPRETASDLASMNTSLSHDIV